MIDLMALMLNPILLVPKLQLGNASCLGSFASFRSRLELADEAGASKTIAFPSWSLGTRG
jgi:hypothetical protein